MPHQRHASRGLNPGQAPGLTLGLALDDLMSGLTDRADLERLFERKVAMPQILRLAGRGIGAGTILRLLDGPEPDRALRKLLDS